MVIGEAAIRAGYAPSNANNAAWRIMQNPTAQAYLKELAAEREKRTGVTQDRVVIELARLAFADIGKLFDDQNRLIPVPQLDDDTRAALADARVQMRGGWNLADEPEAVVSYKMHDKMQALKSLMEHLRMGKATGKEDDPIHNRARHSMPADELRAGVQELWQQMQSSEDK